VLAITTQRQEADMRHSDPVPVTVPASRITDLITVIRAEYEEMPCLCLTRQQVQRLWGLEPTACDYMLRALVDAGYLRLTTNGYVRARER
jgi:hypothetical protein